MNFIVHKLVLNKLRNLSVEEIMEQSQAYQVQLTQLQASQIVQFLRQNKLDPFKEADRMQMLKALAQITDRETAQKTHQIFLQLAKEHGIKL
jgi:LPS O-antigen subunit length determinant protein (WzzB/FepE family)